MRLLIFLLAAALCGLALAGKPPTFSNQYHASGVILLPYAQIREPFTAYFDGKQNRSRIDYYDNLMLTIQKSSAATTNQLPYGAEYKIAYEVDANDVAQQVCFLVEGDQNDLIGPQSVLPDLSEFKFVRKEPCPRVSFSQTIWKPHLKRKLAHEFKSIRPELKKSARLCEKWVYETQVGEKKSTYSFWSYYNVKSKQNVPVHYEMLGYNSLLGSHYDQYEIAYLEWETAAISDDIFNIDQHYDCGSFPGPGLDRKHKITINPIGHYLGNPDAEIAHHFDEFQDRHNVSYPTDLERVERERVFRHNLRYIESKNRQQKQFKLKVNHLADRTPDELSILRGRKHTKGYNGGQPFSSSLNNDDLPEYIDWRLAGAVTPVRDQAICGSCWAFGTVGTIVGVNFVKTGHLKQFSEQQLIDCSWNEGNNGCDGGEDFRVYNYIQKVGGLALDDDYGPFLGVDGKCHEKSVPFSVSLNGFVNVTQYDVNALKQALVENGPVTIAINAAVKTFSFYSNGVYYDDDCIGDEDHLDHQVLLVGYGTLKNEDFWLVKNSWSTHWGNDGYILISQKNNMCGVTTSASYPIIA